MVLHDFELEPNFSVEGKKPKYEFLAKKHATKSNDSLSRDDDDKSYC